MAYVAKITIDHTKVSADLTDYVVYVNLADMPALFWSTVANGGGDIRVYKSDGTTELAREIVACDTGTDTGEMHIKYSGTLSSSVDTEIQIHADGSASEPAFTSTYGRNNVWTDYEMVLHLVSGVSDSTGNGHAQTSSSGVTTGQTGKIGLGSTYSGSASYSYVNGNFPSGATARTISCWAKADVNTGNRFAISYGNDVGFQMMGISGNLGGGNTWWFTSNGSDQNSTVAIDTSAFQKLAFKYTGTAQVGYVNGVQLTSANTTLNTGATQFTIGNYPAQTGASLDGTIDEIRVRESAVSDDWEETEYNNQNSASTFYTASLPSTANTSNFFQFFN
jgi:hypothetical protein